MTFYLVERQYVLHIAFFILLVSDKNMQLQGVQYKRGIKSYAIFYMEVILDGLETFIGHQYFYILFL